MGVNDLPEKYREEGWQLTPITLRNAQGQSRLVWQAIMNEPETGGFYSVTPRYRNRMAMEELVKLLSSGSYVGTPANMTVEFIAID